LNFFVAKKDGFGKNPRHGLFPKTYDMPPFCVDRKVLVTIKKGNYKFLVTTALPTKTFRSLQGVQLKKFDRCTLW
jgi:hypothetical protein